MKEVLKVLRDLRIETSERGNYSQSYANGYTDAISDAIQAVKNLIIGDVRLSFVDWVEENYPTLKNHGDSLTLSELRTAYKKYTNEA